jgi:hypothetical protein
MEMKATSSAKSEARVRVALATGYPWRAKFEAAWRQLRCCAARGCRKTRF